MSKKFTGVHSGGQNIPVYDKDAHSAIEQKLDTSAFQSVSGNFLTAIPDAYATKDYADSAAAAAASGKLDEDTFSQVSGDFLTAVPQSYLQNTDLTVTSGKVTEISGIPLSAGGTLPDTIPVSGVSGISVTETENEVLIGISADFATPTDLESKLDTSAFSSVSGNFLTAVPENYSTKEYLSEQISGKYDTSSFAAVSGDFLTAVPESAISGFATHDEVDGKQDASAMTAYQAAGDYYSASNPSGFLTAIPESALSGYAEYSAISGKIAPSGFAFFTAYRNLFSDVSAAVAEGKICYAKSTVQSNIYYPLVYFENGDGYYRQHLAVFGTFTCPYDTWDISGSKKPGYRFYSVNGDLDPTTTNSGWHGNDRTFVDYSDLSGYMATSGLEYDGDKISGYMGSAFKAGDEVPEGVMVESAVGYNAVNEISGYNGSAIAQYGAEKQWLVHDDTLVHAANSAQYALGVNLSAVAQLLGVDETVLYSDLTGRPTVPGQYFDLSESPLNFEYVEIYLNGSSPSGSSNIANGYERVPYIQLKTSNGLEFHKEFVGDVAGNTGTVHDMGCGYSGTSGTRWTKWYGYSEQVSTHNTDFTNNSHLNIWQVIGIGRKQ